MTLDLTDELRWILGQPCFALIHTAQCLRKMGYTIARKAEDEQAVCIHFYLNLYLQHGAEKWRDEAIKIFKAAQAASSTVMSTTGFPHDGDGREVEA